ncbi:hypothetical protein CLV76_11867 [Marivita geojedonensis]|nr:hypothetical protein CLV76_11867 [Marivita geojedonensis]
MRVSHVWRRCKLSWPRSWPRLASDHCKNEHKVKIPIKAFAKLDKKSGQSGQMVRPDRTTDFLASVHLQYSSWLLKTPAQFGRLTCGRSINLPLWCAWIVHLFLFGTFDQHLGQQYWNQKCVVCLPRTKTVWVHRIGRPVSVLCQSGVEEALSKTARHGRNACCASVELGR